MTKISLLFLLFISTLFGWNSGVTTPPPEAWTDSRLPVKDGLALWLDASREMRARQLEYTNTRNFLKEPALIWHDGSGHARHAKQDVSDHLCLLDSTKALPLFN